MREKKRYLNSSEYLALVWSIINLILLPASFAKTNEDINSVQSFNEKIGEKGTLSMITSNDLNEDLHNSGKIEFNHKSAQIFFIFAILSLGFIFGIKSRKSQITIFIILFLAIAMMFIFLYYFTSQIRSNPLTDKAELTLQDFFEATKFKVYMQECLDKASADGIELIGLQGGRLYQDYPNGELILNYSGQQFNNPQIILDRDGFNHGDNFSGPIINVYCPPNISRCIFGGKTVPYVFPNYPLSELSGMELFLKYAIKKPLVLVDYPYAGSLQYNHNGGSHPSKKFLGDADKSFNDLCTNLSDQYFAVKGITNHCPFETRITYPGQSLPNNRTLSMSIETQLSNYIQENTISCFFSSDFFNNSLSMNITPNYDNLSTNVLIGEDNINIFLDFPLTIYQRNQNPTTKLVEFSSTQNVRLKQIYELAINLIIKDSSDIFFKIDTDSVRAELINSCSQYKDVGGNFSRTETAPCLKEGMEISSREVGNESEILCNWTSTSYTASGGVIPTNENVTHCKSAKVVTIRDNKSLINGKPFEFLFAIENRAPALDLIDREVVVANSDNIFYDDYVWNTYGISIKEAYEQNFSSNIYDDPSDTYLGRDLPKQLIIEQGDYRKIKIFPIAIDPDDENVTYKYEGWLTPTNINDPSAPYNDSYYEQYGYPSNYDVSGGINTINNIWNESKYYLSNYTDISSPIPNSWFDNPGNKFIGKDADYIPTELDVGYHWVRIIAEDKDEPWLNDYQDIFIQVRCNSLHDCCGGDDTDYHYYNLNNPKLTLCRSPDGYCNENGECCFINTNGVNSCSYN